MEKSENCHSPQGPKEASSFTKEANRAVFNDKVLPWDDKSDFENARQGFVTKDFPLVITGQSGKTVFDMERYTEFIKPAFPAPDTVNSSLWRHARLNTNAGLFKITDCLYEVRGYDMANMAVMEGETGYIILDALTYTEASRAAMELVYTTLGKKPIKAVVIGHSHADHFGGICGITGASAVKSGEVKVIAPWGLEASALSENVLAGPVMLRRAAYQFGDTLPVGPTGVIDCGLGKRMPGGGGTVSFLSPSDSITHTGQEMTIDGIKFIFQMAPDSEAPASIQAYLPRFKALWFGENVNYTNHNLCPIRGTLTRDAKKWAGYINEMIELFPEAKIAFGSHFWPVWGKDEVRNLLTKQRDLYKFTHDQTLRLAYRRGDCRDAHPPPQPCLRMV
ncbi:MAG: MBL fold metallo-hydrolase [Dethiobacter sp.]|jgi:alkyl sulfatase BDS1-like metallo-beta-lactamase superfamily hydrolase|nr:MBL fold metallo-hydrolase [Dethiobacter sp.]